MKKTVPTVDEAAVRRVLGRNQGTVTEVIVRLAWCLGLIPDEMHALKWTDVDFAAGEVHLPDRSIPMDGETQACLENRYNRIFSKQSEYVVISDKRRVHMHRVYIFKYFREAMEQEGLGDISLMDLRHDFIIRMLARHSKAYVAKISGTTLTTLDVNFMKYVKEPYREAETEKPPVKAADTQKVYQVIMKEGPSPVGLALWMTWQQKLTLTEAAALTWDQADMDQGVLRLPDRQVPMDDTLRDWLRQVRADRTPEDDPHVLLTPKSRRPFALDRLSRVIRNALVKGGIEQMTLQDFVVKGKREEKDALLLDHAAAHGYVTTTGAMELLGGDRRQVWERLSRLVKEEKLVHIGKKYYQPGTVVPPEKHYDAIRTYLEESGSACRNELTELLHVDANQCKNILHRFVEEGKLVRTKQRYTLPDGGKGRR